MKIVTILGFVLILFSALLISCGGGSSGGSSNVTGSGGGGNEPNNQNPNNDNDRGGDDVPQILRLGTFNEGPARNAVIYSNGSYSFTDGNEYEFTFRSGREANIELNSQKIGELRWSFDGTAYNSNDEPLNYGGFIQYEDVFGEAAGELLYTPSIDIFEGYHGGANYVNSNLRGEFTYQGFHSMVFPALGDLGYGSFVMGLDFDNGEGNIKANVEEATVDGLKSISFSGEITSINQVNGVLNGTMNLEFNGDTTSSILTGNLRGRRGFSGTYGTATANTTLNDLDYVGLLVGHRISQ